MTQERRQRTMNLERLEIIDGTPVAASEGRRVGSLRPVAGNTPPWCQVCEMKNRGRPRMKITDGCWRCPKCGAELMPGDGDELAVPSALEAAAAVDAARREKISHFQIMQVYHEEIQQKRAMAPGGGGSKSGRKRKKVKKGGRTILDEGPTRGEQPRGYRRSKKRKP